jgi:DNA-binding MarR family transcriptional regulator
MPKRAAKAERIILLINRRVRRLGGWNVAVVMAAISMAYRQGRRPSIEALSRQTQLSVGIVHRQIRALKVAGIVECVGERQNTLRRLTPNGRNKIRRLCDLTFNK